MPANLPHLFIDLDGTLTDPQIGITRCVAHALAQLGYPVPDDLNTLNWVIGPPLHTSFITLVGEDRADEGLALYRERFGTIGLFENTSYPGIHDTLSSLKAAGFTLSLATSKPHVYARQIVERFELLPFLDHVFGSELDGTRANKVVLLDHALKATGTRAEASIMSGDRKFDMEGARANKIAAIGVTWGYGSAGELAAAGAQHLVDTQTAWLATIRKLAEEMAR